MLCSPISWGSKRKPLFKAKHLSEPKLLHKKPSLSTFSKKA